MVAKGECPNKTSDRGVNEFTSTPRSVNGMPELYSVFTRLTGIERQWLKNKDVFVRNPEWQKY